jgi:hypothetical protein
MRELQERRLMTPIQVYKQKWYQQNKARILKKRKVSYRTHPVTKRSNDLKVMYGLTLEGYDVLFKQQNGCCAICEKPQSSFTNRLGVDHSHKTKQIRGLLCHLCNRGIGFFQDRKDLLIKALGYLERAN